MTHQELEAFEKGLTDEGIGSLIDRIDAARHCDHSFAYPAPLPMPALESLAAEVAVVLAALERGAAQWGGHDGLVAIGDLDAARRLWLARLADQKIRDAMIHRRFAEEMEVTNT